MIERDQVLRDVNLSAFCHPLDTNGIFQIEVELESVGARRFAIFVEGIGILADSNREVFIADDHFRSSSLPDCRNHSLSIDSRPYEIATRLQLASDVLEEGTKFFLCLKKVVH